MTDALWVAVEDFCEDTEYITFIYPEEKMFSYQVVKRKDEYFYYLGLNLGQGYNYDSELHNIPAKNVWTLVVYTAENK